MKWPRVRIFDLMGVVSLMAVNCLPIRMLESSLDTIDLPHSVRFTALGITPVASLLIVVFVKILRDIRRTGESRPFLAGLFVFGLIGMVGAAVVIGWEECIFKYFDSIGKILGPMLRSLIPAPDTFITNQSPLAFVIEYIFLWLSLVMPQLIVAVSGGLLAKWTGLTFARSRTKNPTRGEAVLVA